MVGKPGPFQIIETFGTIDTPSNAPRRRYECSHYSTCLELAAALNWDNFTCRGCNEIVDQALLWRAHQAKKRDAVADSICEHLPEIGFLEQSAEEPLPPSPAGLRVVGKR